MKHAIRMLGGVLDACTKELARLKICREKLEEDIDQKRQALEVDNEALQMESGWSGDGRPGTQCKSALHPLRLLKPLTLAWNLDNPHRAP